MYYWRYPLVGNGSHDYYLYPYGNLEANFGETYYQWNAMLDQLNGSSPENSIFAIAQLQYHAGIAVNMQYSPNGSGAQSIQVAYALKNYFNYSSSTSYANRSSYTQTNWESMLQNNIDLGRPIYYSGDDGTTGHAFVCDGYQEGSTNYFHFNFGWSGYGDGYFTVNDAGGFAYNQTATKSIYPDDENFTYPYFCNGSSVAAYTSGSIEDGSGPLEDYETGSDCSWLIHAEEDSVKTYTMEFVELDTEANDVITIYDGDNTSADVLGTFSGNSIPAAVTSTGDKVLVTFESDASGSGAGWILKYTPSLPSYCSGMTTLTEPTGTFDDGSGDKNYKEGVLCRWKIEIDGASGINFGFNSLDTEEEYDYIQVLDLGASPPTEIGKFSGSEIPEAVNGIGPLMITFFTNSCFNFDGWEAWYEAENVGVSENSTFEAFSLYPNPSSGMLNIDFSTNKSQDVNIQILSLTGSLMYEENIEQANGKTHKTLKLDNFSRGVYIMQLSSNEGVINKRFVID
jgi:hypothetical protein